MYIYREKNQLPILFKSWMQIKSAINLINMEKKILKMKTGAVPRRREISHLSEDFPILLRAPLPTLLPKCWTCLQSFQRLIDDLDILGKAEVLKCRFENFKGIEGSCCGAGCPGGMEQTWWVRRSGCPCRFSFDLLHGDSRPTPSTMPVCDYRNVLHLCSPLQWPTATCDC